MYRPRLVILVFLIETALLVFGCSKDKGRTFSQYDMWNMAKKIEPNIELVPITEESRRILCVHYGDGCVTGSGRRIKVRKVELIAIQFETEDQAHSVALKINQYYAGNWVLDNVKDEPVLEDFVKRAFNASDAHAHDLKK